MVVSGLGAFADEDGRVGRKVTSRASLDDGERKGGYGVWQRDLYGVGEVLGAKRVKRGWREDVLGEIWEGVESEVRDLLLWRGGKSGVEVFPGKLPWDEAWEGSEGGVDMRDRCYAREIDD